MITPDWPFDDRGANALRTNPAPGLVNIGQREITDHYDRIIRQLPERPIPIGHSLGGVIVQQVLARGRGVAGVAINPAPTPSVTLGPQAIVSDLPVLGDLLSWWKVKTMSLDFSATASLSPFPPTRICL